ncbi:hypothetical protein [Leclercia adecarboxylata]|uniref:DNA polymerase V subunit UmuD n=1 Tax=Leclercia adecarboxylata TaxID=83655 RepID=A0A855EJW7_9ENTR|nr:hypothetical protein [Leclercia adecarboxylata]KFC98595.1 DNA polymerase subunit V [Leclercia adecarboxylata ATCC 23216 = NBRC 102595]PHH04768.1 hypothetical protein CRX53_12775 [Leclercia adecarboxylata]UBH69979.1 hypothetical protein LA332_05035 [Leclercia adecarboxylata]SPX63862.1 Uncharacterised protein [Leclercia adecarboxylata]STX22980.1 Uncharacterised protein [Leclercia adecarboxylata]
MGFPSPASDYIETRLTPERICGVGIDTRILETSSGFAVIEPCTRLVQNQVLLILSGGRTQFARVMGRALITEDGEAIEGEAAEDIEVMGRVTYFINSTDAHEDECPV